jgi:hypothetical protein
MFDVVDSDALCYYLVKLDFMNIVIARKLALSAVEWVAISYPSKDRGRPSARAPHDDAHSFDVDEVPAGRGCYRETV